MKCPSISPASRDERRADILYPKTTDASGVLIRGHVHGHLVEPRDDMA